MLNLRRYPVSAILDLGPTRPRLAVVQACRKPNKICWFANEFAGRLTRRSPRVSQVAYFTRRLERRSLARISDFLCSFSDEVLFGSSPLWFLQLDGQFVELAGEAERYLVVFVVHGCARIDPDIERLVDRHEERNGVWDRLARDLLAVHRENTRAALAMPGPSYLKSKTMVCLPGVSALDPPSGSVPERAGCR